MIPGHQTHWRVTVGKWIYRDGVTTDEAEKILKGISNSLLYVRLERLTSIDEVTA